MDHTMHRSEQDQQGESNRQKERHNQHYFRLLIMAALSFVSMYGLMYAMVNTWGDIFVNLDQFYMAGLMTAPMIIFEVFIMGKMYDNKRLNALIILVSVVLGIVCFVLLRKQTAVSDPQLLRAMIPHHSGAVLMCKEADLKDPEVKALCEKIIASQEEEIEQMKAMLR
jgi:uncharacterized protein (DUF305 family)